MGVRSVGLRELYPSSCPPCCIKYNELFQTSVPFGAYRNAMLDNFHTKQYHDTLQSEYRAVQ